MVFAVDHQHGRTHVDRIARAGAGFGLPAVVERGLEFFDLLGVLMRASACQAHFLPVQSCRGKYVARHQARRLGVVEVGNDQNRGRMLVEPVGHLIQPETHILQTDFLRHRHQGNGGKHPVCAAHEARKNGRIPHPGVEDAQRGWSGTHEPEFVKRAPRDRGFLVARIDEGQILLTVVVEAKRSRAIRCLGSHRRGRITVRERMFARNVHIRSAPSADGAAR